MTRGGLDSGVDSSVESCVDGGWVDGVGGCVDGVGGGVIGHGVGGAVAVLDAADAVTGALLGLDLSGLSEDGLLEVLRRREVRRRREEAFDVQLVAQLAERGVAGRVCAPNLTALLVGALRISRADAGARVRGRRRCWVRGGR